MIYETFIEKSRYARYLDHEKRRENWHETTARYFNFLDSHLQEKFNYTIPTKLRAELIAAVENNDVMPSMRAIMTAGSALARDNTAGYNCFARETKFITGQGLKSFLDFGDGAKVTIMANGWREATVRKFGVERLYKLTVKRGEHTEEIFTTANHRWPTTTSVPGQIVDLTTAQLTPGMTLKSAEPKNDQLDWPVPCKVAIMHGLTFAMGAPAGDARGLSNYVVLRGEAVELARHFIVGAREVGQAGEGDQWLKITGLPWNWKELPALSANKEYLLGFLMGWFAASGHLAESGTSLGLVAEDRQALEWFRSAAATLGIITYPVRSAPARYLAAAQSRPAGTFGINVSPSALSNFFFLREKHAASAAVWCAEQKDQCVWVVSRVEETDRVEEVWCVQVPEVETFTLASGIQTRNCSYLPIDDPKAFDEAMYILLCGTGVGFSVEQQYISKLPEIPERIFDSDSVIVVHDSKEGWAKALRQVLAMLYSGEAPKWDVSKVRPAGSRLKTFGGRASGPEPLVELFKFVTRVFKAAQGRKLNSVECHDIMCKIGEIVVVGGVRRSAMISLSNLSDDRMRHAKSGAWWETQGQRALANNSACYTERPDVGTFMHEWLSLYESKSGERGIFNREAAKNVAKRNDRRKADFEFGTNPCSEIILRPYQFCNLTEIIVRPVDTLDDLKRKARLATILGTYQATLTHFPYLRKIWKNNTEEERLLGVSMTGILDNQLLNNVDDPELPGRLEALRNHCIQVNAKFAAELGINPAAAITCVKPSGTVSQKVDSASGLHPRHSAYYFRRVRADTKDPLTQFMIKAGVPHEPDVMKPDSTTVFTFPKKAPPGAMLRSQLTAIQHLKLWLIYQRHYCEHKPSVTISVSEHEWPLVGAFVWEHFNEMSGVSFLPYDGGSYRQAPYEECTKEQYEELLARIPLTLDWDSIIENDDNVEGAQSLACTATGCEI